MSDDLELEDCDVCAGLGYIEGIDTCCPHCRGEGQIDWIQNIRGKTSNVVIPKGIIIQAGKEYKLDPKEWEKL